MVQYKYLPCSSELPDSDETPVDNELQDLVPHLLKDVLTLLWQDRLDWFFGVDMGIYYNPKKPAIVPDGFLSLGVERLVGPKGRLSYVLWEERAIVPLVVLEVVSQTYRAEYEEKLEIYANLGVPYYLIYNPNRQRKRKTLEVFHLENDIYVALEGEPFWIPELELGIGRAQGVNKDWEREWLYWFDQDGTRLLTPEEHLTQERQRVRQERERAGQAEQRAERLEAKLRALGLEP